MQSLSTWRADRHRRHCRQSRGPGLAGRAKPCENSPDIVCPWLQGAMQGWLDRKRGAHGLQGGCRV